MQQIRVLKAYIENSLSAAGKDFVRNQREKQTYLEDNSLVSSQPGTDGIDRRPERPQKAHSMRMHMRPSCLLIVWSLERLSGSIERMYSRLRLPPG
jgi:hypothetical protein